MTTKLSIIIVNWNTKDLLKQCLDSVVRDIRKIGKIEIIVVDNGSTDDSIEMVKDFLNTNSCQFAKIRLDSRLKLIENKENLGFAKGNNIGIKQAKGEYIMLLNTDTIVKDGALEKLVDFLDRHSEYAVVGPKLLNTDGSAQANCGRFPGLWVSFVMLFKEHFGGSDTVRFSPNHSEQVDWLMGAAFMSRKEVFDKIGGFDERVFMYMEEVEWFFRAQKAGFKAFFNEDAEIVHLGRGSSKSGKIEPIVNIYKGLIHFYRVHKTPLELLILKIMLKTKALISYLLGQIKNDRYLKETYGQALKIN